MKATETRNISRKRGKIAAVFLALSLFVLSGASFGAAAAEASPAFLDSEWSTETPYPEWYGGRYIENGKLIYVLTAGEEESVPAGFRDSHSCVVRPNSYNTLRRTLDALTAEWMPAAPDETVFVQSAGVYEKQNTVMVEIFCEDGETEAETAENREKAEVIKARLLETYGGVAEASVTNARIVPVSGVAPPDTTNRLYFLLLPALLALLFLSGAGVFLYRRRRTALGVRRPAEGPMETADRRPPRSFSETEAAVRERTLTPSPALFDRIRKDAEAGKKP